MMSSTASFNIDTWVSHAHSTPYKCLLIHSAILIKWSASLTGLSIEWLSSGYMSKRVGTFLDLRA